MILHDIFQWVAATDGRPYLPSQVFCQSLCFLSCQAVKEHMSKCLQNAFAFQSAEID